MKKQNIIIMCGIMLFLGNTAMASTAHRLGAGVHYWIALENINLARVDEDGLAFVVSYQHQWAEFTKLEASLEVLNAGYAGANDMVLTPVAYFLLGRALYAGIGAGISYADGGFANSPFFALRTGLDLELLPAIYLDLHANYRFEEWGFDNIRHHIATDTVTLGAVVRLEF